MTLHRRHSQGERPPRRAILVFSDPPTLDRCKRRWPRRLERLLRRPRLSGALAQRADVHLFTNWFFGCRKSTEATAVHRQQGRSFGERLHKAVQTLLSQGYDQIVVVGSDCPELNERDILVAFGRLEENALVLGPDHRGGVYLLAFCSNGIPDISGIRWQSGNDLEQLVSLAPGSVHLLPLKRDVDNSRDLRLLHRASLHWRRIVDCLLAEPEVFRRTETSPPRLPGREFERVCWQLPPPSPHPSIRSSH